MKNWITITAFVYCSFLIGKTQQARYYNTNEIPTRSPVPPPRSSHGRNIYPININHGNTYGNNLHTNELTDEEIQRRKDKVASLGTILKQYVQGLRRTANRQVDLVFLVDSSASVGLPDFKNELKFVRKLLADFTVDRNTTRVSLITFSSPKRVVREVDQISEPSNKHHKCSILEEELPAIKYTGGGTYTLGAMIEAQKVLRYGRPSARKAVFLITDGYSNGGDPRPAAERLKQQDVEIFTFGIRNGNYKELHEMSSDPPDEHTYILNSFDEFEALARRALHEDLHSGTYVSQPHGKCNRLCDKKHDCCDVKASCRCGTHTGKYECMCDKGYYGNGLVGECKPCPEGTYKSSAIPGDISTCSKCPDVHHESAPRSTDIGQCRCRRGYKDTGRHTCKALTCPMLEPPENGYSVQDKCMNVFNAACGIRCNPGYQMVGSSVRLCQENGKWSGTQTKCQVKKCPRLRDLKNGHMSCSKDDFSFETVCHFHCDPGFKLVGSSTRRCLAIAFWNGITPRCREVKCSPLPELVDGKVSPSECALGKSAFGKRCTMTCRKGYKLAGPYSKQCTEVGDWTDDDQDNKCIDVTPPQIECPDDIEVGTDEDKDSAEVDWTVPFALDNSGFRPTVTVIPALVPPSNLPIGNNSIHYMAEDSSKNKAKCDFTIRVKDTQPPRVDKCVSPPPFIKTHTSRLSIEWEEPLFSDNSQAPVTIEKTHPNPPKADSFPLGETDVVYTVWDQEGNNSTCVITIVVKEHACSNPPSPANGDITCSTIKDGIQCKVGCQKGYDFYSKPARSYYCDYDTGEWSPALPFPDCSKSKLSNFVIQRSELKYKVHENCEDRLLLNQVEADFMWRVMSKVSEYCSPPVVCTTEEIETQCIGNGEKDNDLDLGDELLTNEIDESLILNSRRKREAKPSKEPAVMVAYEIAGTLPPEADVENEQDLLVATVTEVMERIQYDAELGSMNTILMEHPHHSLTFLEMGKQQIGPKFMCPPGSVQARDSVCVSCPIGTYFNVVHETCEGCERGTYQPEEGQLTCMVCPGNTSTSSDNAKSKAQCKGQCLPGSFSEQGLEICETCPKGSYQPDYANNFCISCPEGTTTFRRGSRMFEDCGVTCDPGYISKTGLKPCFPCPRGYFQPERGQDACFLCPGNVKTSKKAATSITECNGILEDERNVYSSIPTTALVINECFQEPCINGGVCVTLQVGYSCNCTEGWTGIHCGEEVDECLSMPCHNNATCLDLMAGFNCTCPPGFTGELCEQNIDECLSAPCFNNGTCRDDIDSYHCECAAGYNGTHCEEDIDDCVSNLCKNNATCMDAVAGYTCDCVPGFTGEECEIETDECRSSPCTNNATCVDNINAFVCECIPGYIGQLCELEVDECDSSPCQNNARCHNHINSYTCSCPPAYSGLYCETKLNSTFDLNFPTSAITDYSIIDGKMEQNLTEVSIAFWMITNDKVNYGTVISYATEANDNALTLTDYSGFVFYVNGSKVITDVTANDEMWHHIAVTWTNDGGVWKLYRDGEMLDNGKGLGDGHVIQGGGVFVLGQEQDSRGGMFSTSEAFMGSLSRLNIWNKNLGETEIKELASACHEYDGTIVAWPDFLGAIQGRVVSQPSVLCHDCPTPLDVANGDVEYTGIKLHAISSYSCDTGFKLDGPEQRVCSIDSQWQGDTPQCKVVQCGFPGSIPNAQLHNLNYSYGNVVTFECNAGFRMIGNESLQCDEHGQWLGEMPTCEELLCPKPPFSYELRMVGQKATYAPGSILRFSCIYGHKLFGERILRCGQSGEWDGPLPSCDIVQCYNPPKISEGRAVVDRSTNKSYEVDDFVKYECNTGYIMGYVRIVKCLDTGLWSAILPQCEIVHCDEPKRIENSFMKGDNYTFAAKVEYLCDEGFKLIGESVLECLETGNWNSSTPECREIACESLEEFEHGKVKVESLKPGAVAKFICDKGYKLDRDILSIVCSDQGEWSESIPQCVPITCPEITTIENGFRVGEERTIGDVVEILCNSGFYLVGSPKLICELEGTWDEEIPTCKQTTCGPPVPIANGHYTPEQETYTPSSLIKYKCEENYELDGKETRTCRSDGTWSGPTARCELLECFYPNDIENGKLIVSDMALGSVIEYVCDEGYQLEGPPKRTCSGDKHWSGSDPICGQIPCPKPDQLEHGSFIVESVGRKVTAKFECDEGYNLFGTAERLCLYTKNWSGHDPYCQLKECNKPADIISNGRMISKSFLEGDTIDYVCDSGYYIDGDTKRTCQEDLTWDNPIPVCERVECPRPLRPPNCNVEGFDFRFKEEVTYFCKNGFELVGQIIRICQADKTWSGGEPKCVPVECPEPGDFLNGRVLKQGTFYGNKITYQCNIGYWLIGDEERICGRDKQWSGSLPKCKEVKCEPPPEIDGGEVIADEPQPDGSLKYKCKPGYVLSKPGNLTCDKVGNYTGEKPVCVEVKCPEAPNILNGFTLADGNRYGDAVKFVCRAGFTLIGEDLWKCLENGSWSAAAEVPHCEKVICSPPPTLLHGRVTIPDGYDFGKTLTVECDPGYNLIGEYTRKCTADGQWSGAHPRCEEVACPSPTMPNGYITISAGSSNIKDHLISLDKYVYGMTIEFACERGYELDGPGQLKCLQNQTWSDRIPLCERVKCPKPDIPHALFTAKSGFEFDRPTTVGCENGYELIGEATLYCTHRKTWNRDYPVCKMISCSAPSIQYGKMQVLKSPNFGVGFPFGIVLGFECVHGYEMIGSAEVECLGTKEWSSPAPTCKLTFCQAPALRAGIGLQAERRSYPYGFVGSYKCQSGYEVIGGESFRCGSGGQWEGTPPFCQMMECTKPEIENGYAYSLLTRYISRFKVGVDIYFRCNDGYQLQGPEKALCRQDKTWSVEIPACKEVTCPDFDFEKGNKIVRGDVGLNSYGSRIALDCQQGYHLHGSSSLVCLQSGNWSQPIPTCIKVTCIAPYIHNGNVSVHKQQVKGRYHYEDLIAVECDKGFEPVGKKELMCQLDGDWSDKTPKCEPVKCKVSEIQNGHVTVLENLNPTNDIDRKFRFGTIVGFECREGFSLAGNFDSVCQENGTWSADVPICSAVTCPEINIQHAMVKTDGLTYQSHVFIDCEPDFALIEGLGNLECGPNGTWIGGIPKCVEKQCSVPIVTNGKVTDDVRQETYGYGDTAKFSCDEGFELEHSEPLICQTDRTWSSDIPSCKPVECAHPPKSIEFGSIMLTLPLYNISGKHHYPYGANATVICELGYGTHGKAAVVTCGASKEWSAEFPPCELNVCVPPYINNGTIKGRPARGVDHSFGDSIRFICDDGFYMVGLSEMLCDPDGKWTDPFPICERLACPKPGLLVDGTVIGNSYLYTDEIFFVCEEGFEVKGPSISKCTPNQTWTEYPTCKQIRCPLPQDIKNGEYMAKGFKYKDMIRYSCFKGFELSGDSDHYCTENKTWSGVLPSCERKRCPDPQPMDFARFIGDAYLYKDRVKIECEKGFKLHGEDSMECQWDGTWSELTASCAIKSCRVPAVVPHAVYRVSFRFVYNHTVTYQCDSGYELQGEATMRCLEDGEWSSDAPSCARIYCDAPIPVENGYIEGSQYPAGALIKYHCNEGFILVSGDATQECTDQRTWTGVSPKCTVVLCELQWDLDNGLILNNDNRYGAVIEYVCNVGYELEGSVFRMCLADGTWDQEEPKCQDITCANPVEIDNGYIIGTDYSFDSVVTYACKENYEILGDISRTCQADRTWSGTTPYCRIKTCSPPRQTTIENGKVLGDDFSAGSALAFQCDEGYKLSGPSSIICQGGSSWSSEFPQCDQISCGLPPMLEHSIVDGNAYEYGDKIKFRCKKGYYIVGDPKTTCKEDGNWSVVRARCNPISCGFPPKIENTIMSGDSFSFGDYVYYKCEDGHKLKGNNVLQCGFDGIWSGDMPACESVSCGHPPVIPFASVIVAKTTFGSQVVYHCNRGYTLVGDPKLVCIANGSWVFTEMPLCQPIDCGPPPEVSSGGSKFTNTTLYDTVSYFCDEGYKLQGDASLRCSPEGLWDGARPVCLPISCKELTALENGQFENYGNEFSSDVIYSCNIGYQLIGNQVRVCQADGSWSGQEPRCDLVVCSPPTAPNNGNMTSTGSHYQSTLRYTCSEGFQMLGNATSVCNEYGFWSNPKPLCLPETSNPCAAPTSLPEHTVELSDLLGDFMVGDSIHLSCEPGYEAVGDITITCQDTQTWSLPKGQCSRVFCGAPQVDRGIMIMGNSFYFGDRAVYMCPPGLSPTTPPLITCMENGQWDQQPQCKASCKFECQHGGACVAPNKCKCTPGWVGQFCDIAICVLPCMNGGQCSAPYQCSCPHGYKGARCQIPVCDTSCANGGECVRPNRCRCPLGYLLPDCKRSSGLF